MAVRRRAGFAQPRGYMSQLQGIIAWECCDRLSQIRVPTLIMHGESDRLIPPQNSELIAARITGSQFVKLPRASHLFMTDQPEASQRAILDFLAAHSAPELRNEYQTAS
jgi:pimeloyl-ACP methyl ester carboxylesterase